MSVTWIDEQIPGAVGKYAITSDSDDEYNCIAWAAGIATEWWSHSIGYKWPAHRSPFVDALVAVFASLGFTQCESGDLEEAFDKVAVYAKHGIWKHAARQKSDGRWTSKLGPDEDIEHQTPECLCGDSYGTIHCFMKRKKP